jgi:hypothetical protein
LEGEPVIPVEGFPVLMLPASPPQSPVVTVNCGPPGPAIKGLVPPVEMGSRMLKGEMPGAIVVVEDTAPRFLPRSPSSMELFRGLRLSRGADPSRFPATLPVPRWMDPNITISGGNVASRIYPIGWGY